MGKSTRALALFATVALVPAALHLPSASMTTPAHAKKEKGPGVAAETFINAAPLATGIVRRFLVNPHGEVDALLLTDGTVAKFPPHMGAELTAAVKANDTVSVRGYREPGGGVKAYVITNEGSKQQVVERRLCPSWPRCRSTCASPR